MSGKLQNFLKIIKPVSIALASVGTVTFWDLGREMRDEWN